MKLVFIIGDAAVGKMTVGQELMKITDLRLFHNHMAIEPVIEIFGVFTKPAALTVRLFANMMGGHMIVITLTLLIFIFASFGAAVAGSAAVISILFSVFMLALDVLVSFIQAYVFTLLSTLFIAMAQEKGEHGEAKKEEESLLHKEAEKIDSVRI